MLNFLKVIFYTPLFNLLVFFAWLVPGHSIGWAIIILTVLVRLALWAPSMKGLKAPIMLRQYQDEIKALQERYKDDRQAQAQALMTFYREKGINPLSGCLPLLIQLPIIFILYRVFIAGLQSTRLDLVYSFTPHLTTLNTMFLGINLAHAGGIIMGVLAGVSQGLQSWSYAKLNPQPSNKKTNDPAAMMNKQMIFLFPIMTFGIALKLPAGLALYWIATSLFSLAQQLYIVRVVTPKLSAAPVVVVRQKTSSRSGK